MYNKENNTDRTIDGMNSETFDEINIIDRILVNQDAGDNKQVLKSNGVERVNVQFNAVSINVDSRLKKYKNSLYKASVLDSRKRT